MEMIKSAALRLAAFSAAAGLAEALLPEGKGRSRIEGLIGLASLRLLLSIVEGIAAALLP